MDFRIVSKDEVRFGKYLPLVLALSELDNESAIKIECGTAKELKSVY
jgi:hypothetical protein